jgi:hypothetical protein
VLEAHRIAPATPLDTRRPEVPSALAAVVARMMAKEPGRRFQTPIAVARALAPFLAAPASQRIPARKGETAIETEAWISAEVEAE